MAFWIVDRLTNVVGGVHYRLLSVRETSFQQARTNHGLKPRTVTAIMSYLTSFVGNVMTTAVKHFFLLYESFSFVFPKNLRFFF
jgi:hypothetical protein